MKCTYCHNKIDKDQLFCSNCGRESKLSRKKKSLSTKIFTSIGILIIIIAVSGHFYIKHITSSTQIGQSIYNALMNNDETTFYKLLEHSAIDSESGKEFFQYIKSQDMPIFLKELTENIDNVQQDGITKIFKDENGHELFRLNQVKRFGIYPTVDIVLITEDKNIEAGQINIKGKKMIAVEELKKRAFFTTTMQNGNNIADLYIILKETDINKVESTSVFGDEGNFLYEGNIEFYLAEVNGVNGILQDQLSINEENLVINKEKVPFKVSKFGDNTMVSLTQIETSNYNVINMWTYADGELKEIMFDSKTSLGVSSESVKFIEHNYAQTYSYFNGMGDSEEGIGWTFTTWKWDPLNNHFNAYYTESFTDREPYGWELGDDISGLWNKFEEYYTPFPYLLFTDESKTMAKNGMLLNESVQIGSSIDILLASNPNFYENSYYEGGPYYAYPGGFAYFFEENTREITYISLHGNVVVNSIEDIEKILGEPTNSGYDEMNLEYFRIYQIGEYTLDIRLDEKDEITQFWYYKAV